MICYKLLLHLLFIIKNKFFYIYLILYEIKHYYIDINIFIFIIFIFNKSLLFRINFFYYYTL